MIKLFYSQKLKSVQNRISKLPKYMLTIIDAKIKKDATQTIIEFKNGIKKNDMGLKALKPKTIEAKIRRKYKKPETPLYGKGLDDERSLINVLYVRKLKNGYHVLPSTKKHHTARLTQKDLLNIHEAGAPKAHIQSRPALYIAYTRAMRKNRKYDINRAMQKAMIQYINQGKDSLLKEVQRREESVNK